MTIENVLNELDEAEDSAKEDLKEQWGCDTVDMGGNTIVLSWNQEEDKAGDNAKALSEELYTVAEENPHAKIQALADSDRFTINIQVE